MRRLFVPVIVLIFAPFGLVWSQTGPADEEIRTEIERRIVELRAAGSIEILGEKILAAPLLSEFYRRVDFEPVWKSNAAVTSLLQAATGMASHGLDPADYHFNALLDMGPLLHASPDDAGLIADLDILMTETLARIGYHMRFGKVNPENLGHNWNLSRDLAGRDPVAMMQEAIGYQVLMEFIEQTFPQSRYYEDLRKVLRDYRRIEDAGGWPEVPAGAVMKPGEEDDRVPALRKRLVVTGDLGGAPIGGQLFDDRLKAAVEIFQQRHGLEADGIVGKKTFEALNVPVGDRIDQIRVNLERVRWVFRDLDEEFLVTNIAGYRVHLMRGGQPVWSARAQVGKPYRKTPVFKADLQYLVFNPTWTVPPTILKKDVLPQIRKDPGYLARKNMVLLDRQGKTVDPSTLDPEELQSGRFPYVVRQEPGPTNALGRIKFIFPNEHFVFLHDTPSKGLFDRTERAFSSGCIRVENPFELAERLLDDPDHWNQESIRQVLDSKKTRTVHLEEPLQVLLLYWTAFVERGAQRVHFLPDIYDRDQRVLEGLNADFEISPPRNTPGYLRPAE